MQLPSVRPPQQQCIPVHCGRLGHVVLRMVPLPPVTAAEGRVTRSRWQGWGTHPRTESAGTFFHGDRAIVLLLRLGGQDPCICRGRQHGVMCQPRDTCLFRCGSGRGELRRGVVGVDPTICIFFVLELFKSQSCARECGWKHHHPDIRTRCRRSASIRKTLVLVRRGAATRDDHRDATADTHGGLRVAVRHSSSKGWSAERSGCVRHRCCGR